MCVQAEFAVLNFHELFMPVKDRSVAVKTHTHYYNRFIFYFNGFLEIHFCPEFVLRFTRR